MSRLQAILLSLGITFDVFIGMLLLRQQRDPELHNNAQVLAYQDETNEVTSSPESEPKLSPSVPPTQSPTPTQSPILEPAIESISTTEPTPTFAPTPSQVPASTPEPQPTVLPEIIAPAHLEPLFDRYSSEYGVDKNLLKKIAKCESSFNPGAVNGPYGGMFQYSESRWIQNRQVMGLDPNPELRFNADEAIKTAAFIMVRGGISMWPNCSL